MLTGIEFDKKEIINIKNLKIQFRRLFKIYSLQRIKKIID